MLAIGGALLPSTNPAIMPDWVGLVAHVNLIMLEPEFQIVIDGFVGYLAQQRQVRNTNLLLLGALKGRFLDLRFPSGLPAIAHIGDGFGATEPATLLLPSDGTS